MKRSKRYWEKNDIYKKGGAAVKRKFGFMEEIFRGAMDLLTDLVEELIDGIF